MLKVPAGGWFPLLIGAVAFTLLTTWAKGRKLMLARMCTVKIEDVPYVAEDRRLETTDYGAGFFRVILRHGFVEDINVPAAPPALEGCGPE